MRIEVVPGKLFVSFFEHSIERAPGRFWSFVSEGLQAFGQQEIVFTLKANAEEKEAPQHIFDYFSMVYQCASQGRLVYAGCFSAFGPEGFIIHPWRGLVYAEAHTFPGVAIPKDALTAIAVYEDELEIAQNVGGFRILGRLGKRYSYFPFTPWSDRSRPSAAYPKDKESVLFQVTSFYIRGSSLLLAQDTVTLRLTKDAAQKFSEQAAQIPPDIAFALITQPPETANAWLTWEPGQQNPFAITPPAGGGSLIAGYSLVIGVGQQEDQVDLFEDGFSMLMRPETWQKLKESLRAQRDCTIPTSNLTLVLSMIQEDYYNPVDQRTYHAEGGWHQYSAVQGEESRTQIMLLSSEDELKQAIDANTLSLYIKEIFALLESSSLASGPRLELYLQIELSPGRHPELKTLCKPQRELPEELMKKVASISAPSVRNTIAFQLIQVLGFDDTVAARVLPIHAASGSSKSFISRALGFFR